MLIEVIFKGILSGVNFSFLKEMMTEAREIYFNFPESESIISYAHTVELISSKTYVDLVINTDSLSVGKKKVPKVFINLGCDNENVELMFFFDLKDLEEATQKKSIDYLKEWIERFQQTYSFQYFICQMDNAEKDEYFFDSYGLGKLYNVM